MKATKKLIPAMVMLIVSAVVLSTASYAWFTMSREVTAKGMNVSVTAPAKLFIKGSGDDTYSNVGTGTLGDTYGKIKPASSVDGLHFFAVNDGERIAESGGRDATTKVSAVSTPASEGVDGYYVDFKYSVKTEGNDDVPVYVKSITVTDRSGAAKDGVSAVRAAILNEDGSAANTEVTNTVVVPSGASYAKSDMAISALKDDGTPELAYVNKTVNEANIANKVFTVKNDKVSDITIRVWIEGEDVKCNFKDAANLKFNISIVLADVNA